MNAPAAEDMALEHIRVSSASLDHVARVAVANATLLQEINEILKQCYPFDEAFAWFADRRAAAKSFQAAGWPIAPSMPRVLLRKVLTLHREGKDADISATVMEYYRQDNCQPLADAIARWNGNPYFQGRMSVFDSALKAYRNGDCVLVLSALTPQPEGIASEWATANNIAVRLGKPLKVVEAFIGAPSQQGFAVEAIVDTVLCLIRNNFYAYTDFQKELASTPGIRTVSRHTVAHGIATSYDNEENCLRAFLILDALSVLQ